MACCKCCCGGVDCAEGDQGKCCCGGSSGTCCTASQYCCNGVCQSTPCCDQSDVCDYYSERASTSDPWGPWLYYSGICAEAECECAAEVDGSSVTITSTGDTTRYGYAEGCIPSEAP